MTNIVRIIKIAFETFGFMITDIRYLALIGLVFVLVYRRYVNMAQYELRMFRLKRIKPFTETLNALFYGIGGGFLATFLFIILGISLSEAGITYLWLVALILMLIERRFFCFAYAGGLVSIVALLTGYPQIHVPTLMALVAILHLVEAFLIFIDGHHMASPMYVKHKNGKVIGAFSLQKFWPMPTMALLGITMLNSGANLQTVSMPDWWPIFQTSQAVPADHVLVHLLIPLVVALGYGEVAQTEHPKTKARRSAGILFLYGIALLGLSLVANARPIWQILPATFAPLGHELVIYLGRRREEENEPIFHSDDGVMVMEVYPNSPGEEMGLGAGDVIKMINGIKVTDLQDLVTEVTPWVIDPILVVENQFRTPERREIKFKGKIPPLGIIPTPHPEQGFYVKPRDSFLQRQWKRWRAKRK